MKHCKNKNKFWALKIFLITFVLAIVFSYLSQIAINLNDIFLSLLILIFMLFTSIIADGVAVSVTSCSEDRLYLYKNNDIIVYNIALMLVKNAEKVNNICADVIGDMCGILSGACGVTIVAMSGGDKSYISAVCISSLIVAITVGGKAYLKNIAVNCAEEFVISVAKIMKLFVRKKYENIRDN